MMSHSETKACQHCKNSFTIEPEDSAMYGALDLPAPHLCPRCRWKFFTAFWIFGRFRIANSALSGKRIITVLPESVPFPIYEREEFVSDKWDPLQYGREYDPTRSFLEQLVELQSKVPHPHQTGLKNTNCDWTDDTWESKDAYLTRSALLLEYVIYGYRIFWCKNCVDITYSFNLDESYDCLYCFKGYRLRHSFDSRDCVDSAFLYDCRNCSDCFMSWNLRNKQYCILNQQYTKEQYEQEMKKYDLSSYAVIENLKREFWDHVANDAVHRANFNVQTTNSTGNFLTQGKNCFDCYFFEKSENCRYCFRGINSKDSIDIIGSVSEKCARGCLDQWGYEGFCNLYTSYCRFSAYLDNCEECENCFGCVGLRKKKYCILNKQYTKEEYEQLLASIKADMKKRNEWGEYFPLSAAYAGYNYSLAQMMFPTSKEEALAFGAKWEELKAVEHIGVRGSDLPDRIEAVADDIVKQRIVCPETKLSYNIAPSELQFYRKHNIPLPRNHFDWRTLQRFRPMTLMVGEQKGACVYCNKEIEHYYNPELGYQKIACVECYQREIV